MKKITGVLLEVAREVAEQEEERKREKERVEREYARICIPAESSEDEIQRLRAEISRLQLEVAELKKRSSVEPI